MKYMTVVLSKGTWIHKAMSKSTHNRIIHDMDSSVSQVHGVQEGLAYNGHFGCTCFHPLFCFNQFGDCEEVLLRSGDSHSADKWKEIQEPIFRIYEHKNIRKYFRGDTAFSKPEIYNYLEKNGFWYTIRLPANQILQDKIRQLLIRHVGRPPKKPIVMLYEFSCLAASWA